MHQLCLIDRRRVIARQTALVTFRFLCRYFSALVLLPAALLSTVNPLLILQVSEPRQMV